MEHAVLFSGNPTFNGPFTVNVYYNSSKTENDDEGNFKTDFTDYIEVKNAKEEDYDKHVQDQSCYRILNYPKGRVLLINNEFGGDDLFRKGSQKDVFNMITLWKKLGCEVQPKSNITAEKMIEAVTDFVNTEWPEDFCVVIIMSHGKKDDLVVGSKKGWLEVQKIVEAITRSKYLKGKPKLIFFQMCRDEEVLTDQIDAVAAETEENSWIMSLLNKTLENGRILGANTDEIDRTAGEYISSTPDTLLAFATQPDHVSFRHPEKGSWFIQCITEVFGNHAKDCDVRKLMVMVQEKLKTYEAHAPGRKHDKGKEELDGCDTFGKMSLFLFPGFPKSYKEN